MRPVSPAVPVPPRLLAPYAGAVGHAARRLAASVLRPQACVACDAPRAAPAGGDPFCPGCMPTVLSLERLDPRTGAGAGHRSTIAGFLYAGAVARAVVRLKAERRADLARSLGDLLWSATGTQLSRLGRTVVIPVPLHPARLAERGFNQSG